MKPEWLSTFTVVKLIKKETFGDLYLIKMKDNGELKILRKIKKVLFSKEPTEQIENFRYSLEEILSLDHPNITSITCHKEDEYNFYLV